jgi:hypothetical protein
MKQTINAKIGEQHLKLEIKLRYPVSNTRFLETFLEAIEPILLEIVYILQHPSNEEEEKKNE